MMMGLFFSKESFDVLLRIVLEGIKGQLEGISVIYRVHC